MKQFFKRLFCFHLNWEDTNVFSNEGFMSCVLADSLFLAMLKGGVCISLTCKHCGKIKIFRKDNQPVEYLGP